ncbi:MAG: hypothetical protein HRT45_03065 [Bdellovibrionales bacterium]|nr:hypothetical protein [Bdellovibrionales bacterium]
MNWVRYQTHHSGLGTLCQVFLDEQAGLIKRVFDPEGATVSGQPSRFSKQEAVDFFDNEIFWLKRLDSEWLPKLVDHSREGLWTIQEFYGHSLLDIKPRLHKEIPDVEEQVLEMHRFFKTMNVFKRNGSLSNLTQRDGRLVAFDFKWATERPTGLEKEVFSYENYFVKINECLPDKLKALL